MRVRLGLAMAAGAMLVTVSAMSQAVTEDQAAANRAKPYREGMEAVQRFSTEPGCEGENVATARASIEKLYWQESSASQMTGSVRAMFARYGVEARERRWALQFELADTSKNKGCLDLADGLYRELINIYIGSAFGGIRDRARLGIDDVRELRARR